jgi:gluconolactonase
MKHAPGQLVMLLKDKTNQANGLTRDLQGRLLACSSGARRQHHGDCQHQRLNRDVIVKSGGAICFTDPMNFTPAHDQCDS